jgi:hypothetical protein
MAQSFTIRSDNVALGRKLRAAVGKYPRPVAAGINKVAAGALTLSVREIQKDVGATAQKTIRRNLTMERATTQKLEAKVIGQAARVDRIPLYELRPSPRSVAKRRPRVAGVSYGPLRKLIPGSFIAKVASKRQREKAISHTGVFKRIGEQVATGTSRFTPLRGSGGASILIPHRRRTTGRMAELFGPSVALVFSRRKIMATVGAYIKEKLPIEINRALANVR